MNEPADDKLTLKRTKVIKQPLTSCEKITKEVKFLLGKPNKLDPAQSKGVSYTREYMALWRLEMMLRNLYRGTRSAFPEEFRQAGQTPSRFSKAFDMKLPVIVTEAKKLLSAEDKAKLYKRQQELIANKKVVTVDPETKEETITIPSFLRLSETDLVENTEWEKNQACVNLNRLLVKSPEDIISEIPEVLVPSAKELFIKEQATSLSREELLRQWKALSREERKPYQKKRRQLIKETRSDAQPSPIPLPPPKDENGYSGA